MAPEDSQVHNATIAAANILAVCVLCAWLPDVGRAGKENEKNCCLTRHSRSEMLPAERSLVIAAPLVTAMIRSTTLEETSNWNSGFP